MAEKIINDEKKSRELETEKAGPAIPVEDWKPHIERLTKEIESSKRDQVTILGIFASFITFTSVEFQLLKNISNVGDYVALTLLLLAAMLLFVFALKYLISEDVDKKFYQKPLFLLTIGVLALSIIFYAVPRVINLYTARNHHSQENQVYFSY